MVGLEGIFGIVIMAVFVTVFNFIPCNFGIDACVFTAEGHSYM